MIDIFSPWIFPETVVVTLLVCKGLDALIHETRAGVLKWLGVYIKCADCRGLGYLRLIKETKRRKH